MHEWMNVWVRVVVVVVVASVRRAIACVCVVFVCVGAASCVASEPRRWERFDSNPSHPNRSSRRARDIFAGLDSSIRGHRSSTDGGRDVIDDARAVEDDRDYFDAFDARARGGG